MILDAIAATQEQARTLEEQVATLQKQVETLEQRTRHLEHERNQAIARANREQANADFYFQLYLDATKIKERK